ncbi:hypothetical protein TNIN_316181 [Trichonephila inaurata madagascariensis]|uniref:Uncharacterized protein n=1 Tax=Trichonephila inaurata madagascariensis TaxID=2747483 RepID=A0A8X6XJE1_9ARAC|nr:hypothetical protein TNIN_316181 [Trichonephila inaurata madagascariensis]
MEMLRREETKTYWYCFSPNPLYENGKKEVIGENEISSPLFTLRRMQRSSEAECCLLSSSQNDKKFGGGRVMVCAGISIDGHTGLHVTGNGALSGHRYRDLRSIVVPHVITVEDDFMLNDDNRRPHLDNLVDDFLFEE